MADEKYVIAARDNPFQINLRNMLSPQGYVFTGNCPDPVSFLRLVRSYQPGFVIADTSINLRELRVVLETIEEEMLCACIITGEYQNPEIQSILENSLVGSFCLKPLNRDILVNTVEMTILNYKRIYKLDKKLKEVTRNYETRKAVEMAKAILIKKDGLTENEAYEKIRRRSMDLRRSMKEIAEAIIAMQKMKKQINL